MRIKRDEPFDVQPRANRAMARVLGGATGVSLTLALLGVVVPGTAGRVIAWAAVGVVVAVPLGRVGWLAVRWVLRREYLFALLAAALLLVVGAGGLIALAQR